MPRLQCLAVALFAICAMTAPQIAAAQNPTGMLPFPSSPFPPGMLQPPMLRPPVTVAPGFGHGFKHFRHRPFFPFVFFPSGVFFGNNSAADVQPEPVNPQPFVPTTPPAFGRQESDPTKPYKPPSVEIAPGGIEIIRGAS
jgi:hypothetical protein